MNAGDVVVDLFPKDNFRKAQQRRLHCFRETIGLFLVRASDFIILNISKDSHFFLVMEEEIDNRSQARTYVR